MGLGFRPRVFGAAVREAWPLWFGVAGLIAPVMLSVTLIQEREAAFRVSGTVLQALGLSTVAIGLGKVRRLFDRPPIGTRIAAWFRHLLAAFRPAGTITGHLEGAIETSSALSARLTLGVPPGAPLHRRITVLERNLEALRKEFDSSTRSLEKAISELRNLTQTGLDKQQTATSTVDLRLAEFAVGGIQLEAMGLLWLLAGVIAGTLAPELARI